MTAEPTNAERIRRLPWLIAFDALNSMFIQVSVMGSIFVLMLSELGVPKNRIGILLSIIPYMGVIALVMAPLAAKAGVKRVFLSAWTARNGFGAILLLTPLVLGRFGADATFYFIASVLAGFCLCRSIGEAASYPWRQEVIPAAMRGKFTAIDGIICILAGVAVNFLAGVVIKPPQPLAGLLPTEPINRYMCLLGVGVCLGVSSVMFGSFVPGGAPVGKPERVLVHLAKMRRVFRDRNFLFYMLAMSLVSLGNAPLNVFTPLYLKEQVRIEPSTIVMLQNGALAGSLMSGYFWGWAADRYGSKPVLLTGLCLMFITPVGWLLIPHASAWSVPIALAIFVVSGVAMVAYGIGTGRQLYVGLVPPNRKTQYMSVFVAWLGITVGTAQLLAGKTTMLSTSFSGTFLFFSINSYTPLFLASLVMLAAGLSLQRKVEIDGAMPVRRFVGMFLQGNPLLAVESLMRYNLAGREVQRVSIVERLGRSQSPLSVDELAEALVDPSFNVRYEAIIAIARTRVDTRLTGALIETLIGGQPDLSVAAAWALARVGDKSAIPALQWTFASDYPLLSARSARALATFGDQTIIPELLRRLDCDGNAELKPVYAAALEELRSGPKKASPLMARLEQLHRRVDRRLLLRAFGESDFNVRYEAVILASRCRPDPDVTAALIDLLVRGEPDLSIEAAWALSRLGDPAAIGPLHKAFHSGYSLLEARCARALARFGQTQIIPELMSRLGGVGELGPKIAYASALGELRARGAVGELLMLRREMPNLIWLSELDLALARIAGDERYFIQLWRQMRREAGTVAARALERMGGRLEQHTVSPEASVILERGVQSLARDDFDAGTEAVAELICLLKFEEAGRHQSAILKDCAQRLRGDSKLKLETLPLALHCINEII